MSVLRAVLVGTAVFAFAAPAAAQYAAPPAGFARGQAYAIEVSPGTYVIHRPEGEAPSYGGCGAECAPVAPPRRARRHRRTHNDPALIEELRRTRAHTPARGRAQTDKVIHTTKIVRDKPVVIEHRRVVDDPPRIVDRVRVVDGPPPRASVEPRRGRMKPGEKRVIRAEAEVTIIGPDRMSIRLIRKSGQAGASED